MITVMDCVRFKSLQADFNSTPALQSFIKHCMVLGLTPLQMDTASLDMDLG